MASFRVRTHPGRAALLGLGVGFAMAFVATFLALTINVFESVHRLLVPAAALLRPWSDRMADWNGLVNMVVAGLVNGVVYAGLFVLAARTIVAARARNQRS